jgi:fructan beta-fructosidase
MIKSLPGIEIARPKMHFTPESGWLSDPNGLVFFKGEYHLFFQHNPNDTDWGPMHWGHATSTDLVNWRQLPIAIYPDECGMIFSGSAIVDHQGLVNGKKDELVAFYTLHNNKNEVQCMAHSSNLGMSWVTKHHHPVLIGNSDQTDFRDPKVFEWEDSDGIKSWVMLVAAGNKIELFVSSNLRDWSKSSEFSDGYNKGEGWETPDLFRLIHEESGLQKWALTIGVMSNGPESHTFSRYYLGDFDGKTFSAGSNKLGTKVDHGPDFYAPQTWSNCGEAVWTGWLDNWAYARKVNAHGWKGIIAIPRRLRLNLGPDGYRIKQIPISLGKLQVNTKKDFWLSGEEEFYFDQPGFDFWCRINAGDSSEILIEISPSDSGSAWLKWDVRDNKLLFSVAGMSHGIYDGSGLRDQVFYSELDTDLCDLDLRIIFDRSTLEIFAQDGTIVFSSLVISPNIKGLLRMTSTGGTCQVFDVRSCSI